MGDGSNDNPPVNTSLLPVSALSAECKLKEIILRVNIIWILKSHLGMYDEPPTNKQGIQTNAEPFVIPNMVV